MGSARSKLSRPKDKLGRVPAGSVSEQPPPAGGKLSGSAKGQEEPHGASGATPPPPAPQPAAPPGGAASSADEQGRQQELREQQQRRQQQQQQRVQMAADALTETDVRLATADAAGGESSFLGAGPSGRTYRTQLPGGRAAALKVLFRGEEQPREVFLERVALLSNLKSPHVAPPWAFCADGTTRALAYELAPHGTLQEALHGARGGKGPRPASVLTWPQRVRLALGAAKGLLHIHEKGPAPAAHRALRSSNVLVFDDFVAKVGDFGFKSAAAAAAPPPDSQALPQADRDVGGSGAADEVEAAQKGDVYAFGLLLLELLTGRMPSDPNSPHNQHNLITWALPRLSEDKVAQITDQRMKGRYPPDGPYKLGMVAALCMDDLPFRPAMAEVLTAMLPLTTMEMPLARRSPSANSLPRSTSSQRS